MPYLVQYRPEKRLFNFYERIPRILCATNFSSRLKYKDAKNMEYITDLVYADAHKMCGEDGAGREYRLYATHDNF